MLILVNVILVSYLVYCYSNRAIERFHEVTNLEIVPHNHYDDGISDNTGCVDNCISPWIQLWVYEGVHFKTCQHLEFCKRDGQYSTIKDENGNKIGEYYTFPYIRQADLPAHLKIHNSIKVEETEYLQYFYNNDNCAIYQNNGSSDLPFNYSFNNNPNYYNYFLQENYIPFGMIKSDDSFNDFNYYTDIPSFWACSGTGCPEEEDHKVSKLYSKVDLGLGLGTHPTITQSIRYLDIFGVLHETKPDHIGEHISEHLVYVLPDLPQPNIVAGRKIATAQNHEQWVNTEEFEMVREAKIRELWDDTNIKQFSVATDINSNRLIWRSTEDESLPLTRLYGTGIINMWGTWIKPAEAAPSCSQMYWGVDHHCREIPPEDRQGVCQSYDDDSDTCS